MTATEPTRGRPRLVALLAVLALVVAGGDQLTKYLAEDRLTPGVVVPVVGDFLGLQLIYNPGAAFSLATGMTWIFTVVACVVIVVVLRVARRLRSAAWAVALGLLLGGALGNLYDRLLRDPGFARGHVVDFINYNGWFVGNVADIAIVVAAVLIAVLALIGIEVDGTRIAAQRSGAGDETDAGDVDDDALISEEPLADDEDFSPQVPQAATGDDVDLAGWAAGSPPATGVATVPDGLAADGSATSHDDDAPGGDGAAAGNDVTAGDDAHDDAPAADDGPADGGATPEPGAGGDAAPPRRWRSRREMRTATETGTTDG